MKMSKEQTNRPVSIDPRLLSPRTFAKARTKVDDIILRAEIRSQSGSQSGIIERVKHVTEDVVHVAEEIIDKLPKDGIISRIYKYIKNLQRLKFFIFIVLTIILEGSNIWLLTTAIRATAVVRSVLMYVAIGFSVITTTLTVILFLWYLSSNNILVKKAIFAALVFTSFVTVFSAVFMNMAVTRWLHYNRDKANIEIMKDLGMCDEFTLGVGFLCSGTFAILMFV